MPTYPDRQPRRQPWYPSGNYDGLSNCFAHDDSNLVGIAFLTQKRKVCRYPGLRAAGTAKSASIIDMLLAYDAEYQGGRCTANSEGHAGQKARIVYHMNAKAARIVACPAQHWESRCMRSIPACGLGTGTAVHLTLPLP